MASSSRRRWPTEVIPRSLRSSAVNLGKSAALTSFWWNAASYRSRPSVRSQSATSIGPLPRSTGFFQALLISAGTVQEQTHSGLDLHERTRSRRSSDRYHRIRWQPAEGANFACGEVASLTWQGTAASHPEAAIPCPASDQIRTLTRPRARPHAGTVVSLAVAGISAACHRCARRWQQTPRRGPRRRSSPRPKSLRTGICCGLRSRCMDRSYQDGD